MGRIFSNPLRKPRGFALLVIPFLILTVTNISLFAMTFFIQKQRERSKIEKASSVLEETTISNFVILEAALRRRMWEPPPDANCLRAETFRAYGTTAQGIEWEVTGTFDPKLRAYELFATGKFAKRQVKFKKQIKVMDTSDYLLVSTNSSTLSLYRGPDPKRTAGLIAGDRQIIVNGPIEVRNVKNGLNYAKDWNMTRGTKYPDDYGLIIQAERINALGGIRYTEDANSFPDNIQKDAIPTADQLSIETMIAPYITIPTYSTPGPNGRKFHASSSYAPAVITRDKNLALAIKNDVEKGTTVIPESTAMKNAYPIALFDGGSTFPYQANSAVDDGTYLGDTQRWLQLNYSYSVAKKVSNVNPTCLSQVRSESGAPISNRKMCSYSKDFPKGFAAWRTDADLDGVLLTGGDTQTMNISKIDWDNLDSLKEDALACGAVISSTSLSDYEDCPVWDFSTLRSYELTGDVSCPLVRKVNINTINFNNFDATQYTNDALADRLLRRVIYSEYPIEIFQDSDQGLRTTFADPTARNRLAIWTVGEDLINLRGFQKDKTPAKDDATPVAKEVSFNKDVSNTASTDPLPPLNLVFLTPEKIHLLTEDYKPMTKAHMLEAYPVVSGKIEPKLPNIVDYTRYEDDAFKYGLRDFYLNNVAIISNSNVIVTPNPPGFSTRFGSLDTTSSFFLKGMWAGFVYSSEIYLQNQCFFNNWVLNDNVNDPGNSPLFFLPKSETETPWNQSKNKLPYPAWADVSGTIPPKTSNYYYRTDLNANGTIEDDENFVWSYRRSYTPFSMERLATIDPLRANSSNVTFKGIRLLIDFDSTIPTGKRNLQAPKWAPINRYKMDLSRRRYANPANTNAALGPTAIWTSIFPSEIAAGGVLCKVEEPFDAPSLNLATAPPVYLPSAYKDGSKITGLNLVFVNHGSQQFLQESPDEKFRGLGSLNGIEFPVLEVGN